MEHFVLKHKRLIISVCCVLLLVMMNFPVQAEKRSNGLAITLLLSGVGFQVGSTFLNTSAENKYEEYLSATVQSDIQSLKNDTTTRENASIVMSRVGYGCIGLAVLLSLLNQFHNAAIEPVSTSDNPTNAFLNKQTTFSLTSSPEMLWNQSYGRSHMFSIRPHYDFHNQRASLQFTHRF